jgi:tetratricopeptide (TPR) repeat protein
MSLKELIDLLDRPQELKFIISKMRLRTDLSEEEQGFLSLYDQFNGDIALIKSYLNETKKHILGINEKNTRIQVFYRVAAVFIVLLGVGALFFLSQQMKVNQLKNSFDVTESDLFKEPGIPILMGKGTIIEWAPLMFAIDKESSQKALAEWQKLHKVAPENDTVIYFGGIVHMNLKRTSRARKLFQKNADMESVFADRSVYFLSQIAKGQGDLTEAKRLLERLKNTNDMDLKPFVLQEMKGVSK